MSLYEYVCIVTILGLQKQHEYFLAQQEARKKHTKFNRLDDLMYNKIKAIPDGTMNPKDIANLKKLEDLWLSLSKRMDLLVMKAFTLYQQMQEGSNEQKNDWCCWYNTIETLSIHFTYTTNIELYW